MSMAQQKETISTINDLIETLKDGQEGFRQAAEAVEDRELKTLFNECSLQRARFVGELQSEAVTLGESKPEDSGSTAGALHRSWIKLKPQLPNTTITPFWRSANAGRIRRFMNTKKRWTTRISPVRSAKLFRASTKR